MIASTSDLTMMTPEACTHCGTPLVSGSRLGRVCPRCAAALAIADPGEDPAPDQAGDVFGQYHLIELLGEGGMGVVWLADQMTPVRRRVALKVVKAGADSDRIVARFDAERQALAILNHEFIAKVFDAGRTPDGRPFFVMELVGGEAITAAAIATAAGSRQAGALPADL